LIYIDYDTDIDFAITTIQQVADEMLKDEFWRSLVNEIEPRGIEDIDAGGFTVGLRFDTKPGAYRKAIRDYRRRMKVAFDRAGIKLGTQTTALITKNT
jgi:small conductance mechanosensitive channel